MHALHAPHPRLAALLLPLLMLAGCATAPDLPTYVPPATGEPAARLLLRAAVQPTDRYALFRSQDAAACTQPQLLTGGGGTRQPVAVSVPAGVLTTLDFMLMRADKSMCGMVFSFTPQAGRSYLVSGMTVGASCEARLVDSTQPDRLQVPADLVLRSVGGQRCVPLAQARPVSGGGPSVQGGQVNGEAVLDPRATAQPLEGLIRR